LDFINRKHFGPLPSWLLQSLMDEVTRPRSSEEDDAARRLNLGHGTLGNWLSAVHNAKGQK
jgi:hypothetical protein